MAKRPSSPAKQPCSSTTESGAPCRAWAMHDTDPPLCAIHAGVCKGGAKPANRNAVKHGFHAQPGPASPSPQTADPENCKEPPPQSAPSSAHSLPADPPPQFAGFANCNGPPQLKSSPEYRAALDLAQRTAAQTRAGQDPDAPHLDDDAITRVILDLIQRQEQLSALIDCVLDAVYDQPLANPPPQSAPGSTQSLPADPPPQFAGFANCSEPLLRLAPLLTRLYALHGQNASRLGRLLRDRHALQGDGDFRDEFINSWLELMSVHLGVDL